MGALAALGPELLALIRETDTGMREGGMQREPTAHGEVGTPDGARAPVLLKLLFPGLSGPVFLSNDQALLQGLITCLTGWFPQISIAGKGALRLAGMGDGPLAVIEAETSGLYRYRSRFTDQPARGLPLASAICALVADMSQDWCETRADTFGLHCGALLIGGRLVLIVGRTRAGKSTLVTRLAAEPGVGLWCDDILPVTAGEGVSVGIAPRLRLPVPEGSALLAHMAEHALTLADDRYGYVSVPDQAAWGDAAGIGAIILLDRREGAAACLHRLEQERAVELLLRQLISGFDSAEEALAVVGKITTSSHCLRLVCSDVDEAAALVMQGFSAGDLSPQLQIAAPIPDPETAEKRKPAAADLSVTRVPGVVLRRQGDSAFLWHPGEAFLWRLNQVALAVWQMLELPGSARDLAEALGEIYPGVPKAELLRDIRLLIADLLEAELVVTTA